MSKIKFATNAQGQPVAIERKGRKSYEKKIEKLAIENSALKGAVMELRSRDVAPPPPPAAAPPPASPPPAPKQKTYRELRDELRASGLHVHAADVTLQAVRNGGIDAPIPAKGAA